MRDTYVKLVIGSLLHDIGKILYRYNDGRNHSKSGAEFLQNEVKINDSDILDQVRFHHMDYLKNAKVKNDSLAYITYIADNISSATDRRKNDTEEFGFDRNMPLESIFNLLNGHDEKHCYSAEPIREKINYPKSGFGGFDEQFYGSIVCDLKKKLEKIEFTEEYVNSLIEVLEEDLSFIPSSTNKGEVGDISLYDHVKLTAAFSLCIVAYLEEKKINDYKQTLFININAKQFYSQRVFLLFSMDMSGIQDFIYTIISKDALKSLRSRSFYLEILMEHIIDELLKETEMSRANLLYSGGGHAYLILPNTDEIKDKIGKFEKSVNAWLLEEFHTALYLGCGYQQCSANELHNYPKGSYRKIFQSVASQISEKKTHRYDANELLKMNFLEYSQTTRECKVCRRSDSLNKEDICPICSSLIQMSKYILHRGFFVIVNKPKENVYLPMPNEYAMIADSQTDLLQRMKEDKENYIRSYTKNEVYSGSNIAKRLWVGDYTSGETFEELANESVGINRIAVLRADVDNLGTAFVNGFASEKYGEKYMTISRTATFSRKMSMFFKYHINAILNQGEYYIAEERKPDKRKITIVYSGGDDLFVVGSWDEIIGFAVDLHDAFSKFTQNTLSISAGIGIYPSKYPIHHMAARTGELEDCAKHNPGKNAVTLFEDNLTFDWDTFKNNVLKEKLVFLKDFFNTFPQKGKAYLYRMLDLIRNMDKDTINLARLAYTMARLEDDMKQKQEKTKIHSFSFKIYQWIQEEKNKKALIAAIYLYIYLNREKD